MRWRTDQIPVSTLIFISSIAIVALILAERSITPVKQAFYQEKLQAAKKMLLAMNAIREEEEKLGIAFDPVNDPHKTGMIGQEFTLITTDRGDLAAKLTTTDPDFGGIMVEMLSRARLRRGDYVAVAVTGSFPALNIAVVTAAETLGLKPILITSVGSSSWGANDPRMTWLDMEQILVKRGICRTRSIAASLGGGKDVGRGLSPEGRQLILEAMNRNGIRQIQESQIQENIRKRMELYDKSSGKRIKAYINVGGGVASLGASINGELFPSGLSFNSGFRNFPTKGVINLMSERGIPVIHLLNIQEISKKYLVTFDPANTPEIGEGPIYFKDRYDRLRLTLILLGLLSITIIFVRFNVLHYLNMFKSRRLPTGSSRVEIPADEPGRQEGEETTRSIT